MYILYYSNILCIQYYRYKYIIRVYFKLLLYHTIIEHYRYEICIWIQICIYKRLYDKRYTFSLISRYTFFLSIGTYIDPKSETRNHKGSFLLKKD